MAGALRGWWRGGSAQLAWVLERCADEVTYDLAVRGLDLGELWRQRRWHFLWVLILGLPRNSLTKEALSLDEEFAVRLLDHEETTGQAAVRMSEFSPEVEASYAVVDRLADVIAGLIQLGGGTPPRIPAMPRPKTALDRLREERRVEKHRELVRRFRAGQRPPS